LHPALRSAGMRTRAGGGSRCRLGGLAAAGKHHLADPVRVLPLAITGPGPVLVDIGPAELAGPGPVLVDIGSHLRAGPVACQ
jgi:hypothetical protein